MLCLKIAAHWPVGFDAREWRDGDTAINAAQKNHLTQCGRSEKHPAIDKRCRPLYLSALAAEKLHSKSQRLVNRLDIYPYATLSATSARRCAGCLCFAHNALCKIRSLGNEQQTFSNLPPTRRCSIPQCDHGGGVHIAALLNVQVARLILKLRRVADQLAKLID